MSKETSGSVYYPEFVYSSANRIFHWLRVISITTLTVTGFYIAEPFLAPGESTDQLLFGEWLFWHLVFGFVLVALGLLRVYLFFFEKDKGERTSVKDAMSLRSWITQLKSYFFIGELEKKGIYGPLQFVTYAMITMMILLASLTGLILYVHAYHQGLGGLLYAPMRALEPLFGGLANVRLIHHITMWGFIIFVPIHVYMVIWSAIRFRHNAIDVMFTGYDYHKKRHEKES